MCGYARDSIPNACWVVPVIMPMRIEFYPQTSLWPRFCGGAHDLTCPVCGRCLPSAERNRKFWKDLPQDSEGIGLPLTKEFIISKCPVCLSLISQIS